MANIHELAEHHRRWLDTAFGICNDRELAKDIVQDMYIKLYECKRDINAGYVYRTLKSIFIDGKRRNREIPTIEFTNQEHEQADHYEDLITDVAKQNVFDALPTYKQIIITHSQNKGVRTFAIESNIDKNTISNIRNEYKRKICLERDNLVNQQQDSEILLLKLQTRLGLNHAKDVTSARAY